MHYCYECQAKFLRLRDLSKHERIHRRRGHCVECDVYFTSKAKESEHFKSEHTRSIATQTEEVRAKAPQKRRPVIRDYRAPRWRPAPEGYSKPAPRPQVPSMAVRKGSITVRAFPGPDDDDDDIDLNDTTDLNF